jgi:hypothetical protein
LLQHYLYAALDFAIDLDVYQHSLNDLLLCFILLVQSSRLQSTLMVL